MHHTCTNTSFKPDRRKWMTRREKQWRRILSTSLLEATVPSDEVSSKSDCENRTGKNQIWFESRFEIQLAGSRLGRLPWTKMKKIEQVRGLSVPNPYHCATDASSLDGDIWSTLHPPAKKEVLHLYRWFTHTHTLPQEGEKLRSRPWDGNEEERKWKWGEDDNEMKVT